MINVPTNDIVVVPVIMKIIGLTAQPSLISTEEKSTEVVSEKVIEQTEQSMINVQGKEKITEPVCEKAIELTEQEFDVQVSEKFNEQITESITIELNDQLIADAHNEETAVEPVTGKQEGLAEHLIINVPVKKNKLNMQLKSLKFYIDNPLMIHRLKNIELSL